MFSVGIVPHRPALYDSDLAAYASFNIEHLKGVLTTMFKWSIVSSIGRLLPSFPRPESRCRNLWLARYDCKRDNEQMGKRVDLEWEIYKAMQGESCY